jgi:murein L,D-transpeptidase YcbB/YkuD
MFFRRRPTTFQRFLRLVLMLLLGAAGTPLWAQSDTPSDIFREALRDRVGLPAVQGTLAVGSRDLQAQEEVTRFYLLRAFNPAWIDENGQPSEAAAIFSDRLAEVTAEGLDPARYRHDDIRTRFATLNQGDHVATLTELVDFELLLTDSWLTLAAHLLRGRVDPERLYGQWLASPRERDLVMLLDTALASNAIGQALDELLPAYTAYGRLRAALAQLRAIDPASEPPRVAPGPTLRLGAEDERVPAIRRRLRFFGDLPEDANLDDTRFDGQVDAALLNFQARHGLDADGIFGSGTRAALNASLAERSAQIALNMERFRWLPQKIEARHLRVNIADFRLDLIEDDLQVMTMDVIVGRAYRQTPVFSGRMTYLVFSPAWHLPPTISRKDILPRLRRDPQSLAADGIRVLTGWGDNEREVDPASVDWRAVPERNLPYHFRQDPGPQNALGRVKFMFPNRFSVYLHDTPARELFDRTQRDFSSGCIRVERPQDLATHLLLEDPAWTPDRIAAAMVSGKEQAVTLPRPLPVYIYYQTAWVDDDGALQFREDIYGRDQGLQAALAPN